MSPHPATRERIESLIASNDVVLFMKGTREAPQCGFSAAVVQILDSLLPEYGTFDVLSDGSVREGIKEYSAWPTIPQLYLRGEFLGGCDIVRELHASGELAKKLGVELQDARPPELRIGDAALAVLRDALAEAEPGAVLHLGIDARFQGQLSLGPASEDLVVARVKGIEVHMDRLTASRADGVGIELVDTPRGRTLRVERPQSPDRRPA